MFWFFGRIRRFPGLPKITQQKSMAVIILSLAMIPARKCARLPVMRNGVGEIFEAISAIPTGKKIPIILVEAASIINLPIKEKNWAGIIDFAASITPAKSGGGFLDRNGRPTVPGFLHNLRRRKALLLDYFQIIGPGCVPGKVSSRNSMISSVTGSLRVPTSSLMEACVFWDVPYSHTFTPAEASLPANS